MEHVNRTDTSVPTFGVRLPVAGPLAGPDSIGQVARDAEALDYDYVSVHDFIAWSPFQNRTHISCGSLEAVEAAPDTPPYFYESLTSLAFVAATTTRLRLLLSVLALPYRHPVVAAKQAATIDQLSKGRLILGIGVGAARSTHNSDFELLNVSRVEKYDRTRDYLRAMQTIWSEPEPAYEGQFVGFPPSHVDPKPVQDPLPIWIGGGGPRSMAIAAELGTGWIPVWISPEQYPARIHELYQAAATNGRSDVRFEIGTTVHASIARDSQAAVARARRTVSVMGEGFADDATDAAIEASGLVGSPAALSEKLQAYVAAGVQHFELRFIYHDLADLRGQLELFREVADEVRAGATLR
jgi:probable F420-dependent oxidoreductase